MEELGISLKHQKKLKKRSRTKGRSSFASILTCHQRRTLRKETMAWTSTILSMGQNTENFVASNYMEKFLKRDINLIPQKFSVVFSFFNLEEVQQTQHSHQTDVLLLIWEMFHSYFWNGLYAHLICISLLHSHSLLYVLSKWIKTGIFQYQMIHFIIWKMIFLSSLYVGYMKLLIWSPIII